MAWFNYDLQPSKNLADYTSVKGMMASRDAQRIPLDFSTLHSYSIVGMDVTKVGTAIQAIDEYVQAIENKVRQVNENTNINTAIKSDVIQTSVKNYIERVEEYCANLCSQLRMFRDKLQEAEAAWKAETETLSQIISEDASKIDTGTHKQ